MAENEIWARMFEPDLWRDVMVELQRMLRGDKMADHPCLVKWRTRVDRAEREGGFDESDQADAGNWKSCACGEAYESYHIKYLWGTPVDMQLTNLGHDFYYAVCGDKYEVCRTLLTAIERRLAALAGKEHGHTG